MSKDKCGMTRKRFEKLMAGRHGVQLREVHDMVSRDMVGPQKAAGGSVEDGKAPVRAQRKRGEAGMTLEEAMKYRGETVRSLAKATETAPSCVKRWVQPGGLERLSAVRLQQIARALDGGVLVTEDGCEVELYGGKAR